MDFFVFVACKGHEYSFIIYLIINLFKILFLSRFCCFCMILHIVLWKSSVDLCWSFAVIVVVMFIIFQISTVSPKTDFALSFYVFKYTYVCMYLHMYENYLFDWVHTYIFVWMYVCSFVCHIHIDMLQSNAFSRIMSALRCFSGSWC